MAKKYIDVMDVTFSDSFESIYREVVPFNFYLPAVEFASSIGIENFEFIGANRFLSYNDSFESPFTVMQKFRMVAGPEANLQISSHATNLFSNRAYSYSILKLFAKVAAKYETTTIANYDPINDIRSLSSASNIAKNSNLMNEITITIMNIDRKDCSQMYIKLIKEILDMGIEFDSIAFKDPTGTSIPADIYKIIRATKEMLGEDIYLRFSTTTKVNLGVVGYLSAIEAGVDCIDLSISPFNIGGSQPDMLSLIQATKGTNFSIANLDLKSILEYKKLLQDLLNRYNSNYKFDLSSGHVCAPSDINIAGVELDIILDVMERGGFATPMRPISTYYLEQSILNSKFGRYKKLTKGYAELILGYFGQTLSVPDPLLVEIARDLLKIEPTVKEPIKLASLDFKNELEYYSKLLEDDNIETSDENILLSAINRI